MSPPAEDPLAESLDQVAVRLARIETLLRLAFSDQVDERRARAGVDDEVTAAILDECGLWIRAGDLKTAAKKTTGASQRTIENRLQKLLEIGALEDDGQGSTRRYRSTGKFG